MAQRLATLTITPRPLAEALQLTLALTPGTQGQQIAQRELVSAIEQILDARRQRIIISQSQVNSVKWACLLLQALCALLAIAMVHSDNRLAATLTMGIFATGVAASVLLIAAHDRPFTGELSVGPDPLLQVMPETEAGTKIGGNPTGDDANDTKSTASDIGTTSKGRILPSAKAFAVEPRGPHGREC
jgi:hypothetical protein